LNRLSGGSIVGLADPGAADLDWRLVVHSLQCVMGYPSVVGGRTALEEHGFAHYLRMRGEQPVHLYGQNHPSWLKRLDNRERFRLHGTELFDDDGAVDETTKTDTPMGVLVCSTAERAILEMIDELPRRESFHNVDTVFEALASARPRRLERLLSACRSVKVTRLFFVFADRHGHAWRRYLSPDDFNLGSGPRMLVENGRFHPRYKISVPEELITTGGVNDAA